MKELPVESVCVFGSTARSSIDKYSDRDVLIVTEDGERQRELANFWIRRGWSVASYTPNRLWRMIGAGSLFVQHLKLEGRMVADRAGWLAKTLCGAMPKESYASDAMASIALARPIERFDPRLQLSEAPVSADLAYVAVRNFGICFLADQKQISFDYAQIINRLGKEFCLSSIEIELLRSLRTAKSFYRRGVGCGEIEGSIEDLSMVLSKFFVGQPLTPVDPRSPVRRLAGGYSTIRDLEASIVARCGGTPTKAEIHSMGLDDVWRWVKRPRDYTWGVRNCSVGQLNRLLAGEDSLRMESRGGRRA